MSKQLLRFYSCAAACLLAALQSTASAGLIAHWSFDTPSITTDANGILTASDATGNHNATSQLLGTGAISSVAGQFGQAASFNNANANGAAQTANQAWMSFPQLTEIAGPSGTDFTVAVWAKVDDQASWDDNPILADWGNAPANTRRFTYWFQHDNVDSNAGLRPRAQMRAANTPVDPTNIDIIATTLSSAQAGTNGGATNFDDGAWHHLAWVWNKTTGQMKFYTDGLLRHTQTSTQTGANLNIAVSDSLIGAIGAKRDNNRYYRGSLDELWVVGSALGDAQVAALFAANIVPEPGTTVLLAFGIAGLAVIRRKRR